ncbi:MAG: hypothetical protein A2Z72_06270 [Omnitrophica bacterium RBG_13_46_9]|nr:MAG: hypothetical protein A2Z72_06270 [Omnitrophica bacterium RBG_13_46_9]
MRKIIFTTIALAVFLNLNAYTAEPPTLLEFRNKIFDESKDIKLLLTSSKKDMIFMNSMWDSCIATLIELDAFFGMLGIFNTIKREDVTEGAVTYLYDWLSLIKNSNESTIRNLNTIYAKPIEKDTKLHIKKLIAYYTELNDRIGLELTKIMALKSTAKKIPSGN